PSLASGGSGGGDADCGCGCAAGMPAVTVEAADPTASETATSTGAFRVTRTGDLVGDLTVHYAVSGTATNGVDYQSITGTVTIPDGQATAAILITPVDDTQPEPPETVVVTVSADPAYSTGNPSSATVTIFDDDGSGGTTVWVTASGPDAYEMG